MSHSVHLQKLVLDLYGELIEEVTEKTGTVQGKRYWPTGQIMSRVDEALH